MYDNDHSEYGSIHDWVGDSVTDVTVTVLFNDDAWLRMMNKRHE